MPTSRKSRYTDQIIETISTLGHATNFQILEKLRDKYPLLSATTVHRATARLYEQEILSRAPIDDNGCIVYDANITPHDHFICSGCHTIRDIDIYSQLMKELKKSISDCDITGRLTINGKCLNCKNKENK